MINFDYINFELRDYQKEARVNINTIYSNEEYNRYAAVVLPTGGGKSFVSIDQILNFNHSESIGGLNSAKMLYLAPRTEILSQVKLHIVKHVLFNDIGKLSLNDLNARLSEDLGLTITIDDEWQSMTNGEKLRNILAKLSTDNIEALIKKAFPNLIFKCYQSLDSIKNEEFSFIIADEVHRLGAEEWGPEFETLVENNKNAKILGITATPERNDEKGKDMIVELSKIIYGTNVDTNKYMAQEMYLADAIEDGIVTSPRIERVNGALVKSDEYKSVLIKYKVILNGILNKYKSKEIKEIKDIYDITEQVQEIRDALENMENVIGFSARKEKETEFSLDKGTVQLIEKELEDLEKAIMNIDNERIKLYKSYKEKLDKYKKKNKDDVNKKEVKNKYAEDTKEVKNIREKLRDMGFPIDKDVEIKFPLEESVVQFIEGELKAIKEKNHSLDSQSDSLDSQSDTSIAGVLEELANNGEINLTGKYIAFLPNNTGMEYDDFLDIYKQKIEKHFENIKDENGNSIEIEFCAVSSKYDAEDNSETLKKFETASNSSGKLKILLSQNMLNEGIHVDGIDGALMYRKCDSPNVYLQQLGRCVHSINPKLSKDKQTKSPIVIDAVGNSFEQIVSNTKRTISNSYDLSSAENVKKWIKDHGRLPKEDISDVEEVGRAMTLKRLVFRYAFFITEEIANDDRIGKIVEILKDIIEKYGFVYLDNVDEKEIKENEQLDEYFSELAEKLDKNGELYKRLFGTEFFKLFNDITLIDIYNKPFIITKDYLEIRFNERFGKLNQENSGQFFTKLCEKSTGEGITKKELQREYFFDLLKELMKSQNLSEDERNAFVEYSKKLFVNLKSFSKKALFGEYFLKFSDKEEEFYKAYEKAVDSKELSKSQRVRKLLNILEVIKRFPEFESVKFPQEISIEDKEYRYSDLLDEGDGGMWNKPSEIGKNKHIKVKRGVKEILGSDSHLEEKVADELSRNYGENEFKLVNFLFNNLGKVNKGMLVYSILSELKSCGDSKLVRITPDDLDVYDIRKELAFVRGLIWQSEIDRQKGENYFKGYSMKKLIELGLMDDLEFDLFMLDVIEYMGCDEKLKEYQEIIRKDWKKSATISQPVKSFSWKKCLDGDRLKPDFATELKYAKFGLIHEFEECVSTNPNNYGEKYDENGYDREGYNKEGYNKLGFNKNKIHKNTGTKYDERGFYLEGEKYINIYSGLEFDLLGYNIYDFNKDGFERTEGPKPINPTSKFSNWHYKKPEWHRRNPDGTYDVHAYEYSSAHQRKDVHGFSSSDKKAINGFYSDGTNKKQGTGKNTYSPKKEHFYIDGLDIDGYNEYGFKLVDGVYIHRETSTIYNKDRKVYLEGKLIDYEAYLNNGGYNEYGFKLENGVYIHRDTLVEYDKCGRTFDGKEPKTNIDIKDAKGIIEILLKSNGNGLENMYKLYSQVYSITEDEAKKQIKKKLDRAIKIWKDYSPNAFDNLDLYQYFNENVNSIEARDRINAFFEICPKAREILDRKTGLSFEKIINPEQKSTSKKSTSKKGTGKKGTGEKGKKAEDDGPGSENR